MTTIQCIRDDDRHAWLIRSGASWVETPWRDSTPWEFVWRYYRDLGVTAQWVKEEEPCKTHNSR